jgi:5'-phosphate synthase pdxT subunit
MEPKTIGVLALQGAFSEHINAYSNMKKATETSLELRVIQVKTPADLDQCSSLILPGGESTAIALAAKRNDLFDKLVDFIQSGKPVWVCKVLYSTNSAHLTDILVLFFSLAN